MAIVGQFGYWKFEVNSKFARSFKNLQITSECETEDKTADSQKYVSAKNGKPVQITLTVVLCAYLGADVRGDVVKLIDTAQRSGQGYFYIQSKKLFPFMLMLTKADVKNIGLSPSGKWISCEVGLTLKQSSKEWILGAPQSSGGGGSQSSGGGGNGGGSSSRSKKASVKTKGTKSRLPMTGVSSKSIAAVAAARKNKTTNALSGKKASGNSTTSTINSAQSVIKKNTTAAKKATETKKKTKSGGGGGSKVRRTAVKY